MRMCRVILGAGLPAMIACASGGCQDPEAPAYTAMRQAEIRRTLELYEARERASVSNLQQAADRIERAHNIRVARAQANERRLRSWFTSEFREWHDTRPDRNAGIQDYLDGSPEKIMPTIRAMFY